MSCSFSIVMWYIVAAAAVKVVWIWYLASRLHEEIHTSAGSEKRIGSDDNNFPPPRGMLTQSLQVDVCRGSFWNATCTASAVSGSKALRWAEWAERRPLRCFSMWSRCDWYVLICTLHIMSYLYFTLHPSAHNRYIFLIFSFVFCICQ